MANRGSLTPEVVTELQQQPQPKWIEEPQQNFPSWPPPSWKKKALKAPWSYLLDETPPGPVTCVRRGKVMVMACGHVCHFLTYSEQ